MFTGEEANKEFESNPLSVKIVKSRIVGMSDDIEEQNVENNKKQSILCYTAG
jgi:hypothetical protein